MIDEKGVIQILIVDDEPSVRATVKMILQFCGYRVHTVENGTEALTCLESYRFDLVITDYSMHGIKGDELAQRIKTRWPVLLILMVTAYADMWSGSKPPGVDAILGKPFMLDELKAAVAELLARRNTDAGQTSKPSNQLPPGIDLRTRSNEEPFGMV